MTFWRNVAILLGTVAAFVCLPLIALGLSWLEISSEAHAFPEAKLAQLRQEHLDAAHRYGGVALVCGLLAVAIAGATRDGEVEPKRRETRDDVFPSGRL